MSKKPFILIITFMVIGLLLFSYDNTAGTVKAEKSPELTVGVFNSRAVALAYGRSKMFNSYVKDLRDRHEKAEKDNDKELIAKLELQGQSQQQLMHAQVFGSAAIDDIIEKINDHIPQIAKQSGTDIIISSYDIVYKDPKAKVKDITDQMVELFEPDETTRKMAKDIVNYPPLSKEKLESLECCPKH